MPLRGLLVKHQKIYLYRQNSSMFPTLPKGSAEYCIFFENRTVDSKICYQKKQTFQQTCTDVGRRLTDLKFCFITFLPFLCTDVTPANFKDEGKLEDLISLSMLVHKLSANISIFFLIILVGISGFCEALDLSKVLNFFFDFPNFHFLQMKCFVLANVIFVFHNGFVNWILDPYHSSVSLN